MDEVEPATKKPRLQETQQIISRCENFWFEDGTVILQTGVVQFKVHKSVLSKQSDVFRDMFLLPQPTDEPTSGSILKVEECPIVVLHDSLDDVNNLLTLLYDPISVHNFRRKKNLSVLATMIRLGRKYGFKHLRAEALHCLRMEFPTTLAEWDKRKGFRHIQHEEGILFKVAYIAHENSIRSILPTVYLLLCLHYPSSSLVEAFTAPAYEHLLKTEEPLTCILGRERLVRSVSKISLLWLQEDKIPCGACISPRSCTTAGLNLIKRVWALESPEMIGFAVNSWTKNKMGEDS